MPFLLQNFYDTFFATKIKSKLHSRGEAIKGEIYDPIATIILRALEVRDRMI